MKRSTTDTLGTRTRFPSLLSGLVVFAALAASCSGGSAAAPGAVEAMITSDGSFEPARVTRLLLAIDGDGEARVNVDVPLTAGFGSGLTTGYQPKSGTTLVLAAYALDASGARVASGVANPVVVASGVVAVARIVLASSGRVDAGAPRDLAGPPPDLTLALPDLQLPDL